MSSVHLRFWRRFPVAISSKAKDMRSRHSHEIKSLVAASTALLHVLKNGLELPLSFVRTRIRQEMPYAYRCSAVCCTHSGRFYHHHVVPLWGCYNLSISDILQQARSTSIQIVSATLRGVSILVPIILSSEKSWRSSLY